MTKFTKVLAVACSAEASGFLASAAGELGEKVVLVCAANPVGADEAYIMAEKENHAVTDYVGAVAELAKAVGAELILTDNGNDGRLMAGMLSAKCGLAIAADPSELTVEDGKLKSVRMVYGGAAFKTEVLSAPAVVCMGAGVFAEKELAPCENTQQLMPAESGVALKGKKKVERKKANLATAKRVLAVGRGVPDEEVLHELTGIAERIGAEMGCTRPVAEDNHWLPKESYIGVSGVMMKPNFYLGIGISGQVQHMVGISQSGTIAAICKDKNAPIFKQCDYGLVADIAQVLPLLSEKLK